MNSWDEDLFAISDDETLLPPMRSVRSANPVEEYLSKHFANVQNRIDTTTNEIKEVKATTGHILNALEWRALYGENIASSDSDSDVNRHFTIH